MGVGGKEAALAALESGKWRREDGEVVFLMAGEGLEVEGLEVEGLEVSEEAAALAAEPRARVDGKITALTAGETPTEMAAPAETETETQTQTQTQTKTEPAKAEAAAKAKAELKEILRALEIIRRD